MNSYTSTNHPGLTDITFDIFWSNLLLFATKQPMFPHPKDLVASAAKLQRDNDLMLVALETTKTAYPRTVPLRNHEEFLVACSSQQLVVKRDFSDCNIHLLIRADPANKEHAQSQWEKTQDMYRNIRCLPRPTWFAQQYVPALQQKGELRAFVAGTRMFHCVHTWVDSGGNVCTEVVDNVTPLNLVM